MTELLKDQIIGSMGPIIIPFPYVGTYESKIEIFEVDFLKTIDFYKGDYGYSYNFVGCDINFCKEYILENIFKIQESMILYHDIEIEFLHDIINYVLKIHVVKGNISFTYRYNSANKKEFINYIIKYSNIALQNNFMGIKNELDNIINNTIEKSKFKAKRKSLL